MGRSSKAGGAVVVDDVSKIENELGAAVGQNQGLRSALDGAKQAIALQEETIKALTQDRYALGTVLSFQPMHWREPRQDELLTGSIVRTIDGGGDAAKVIGFDETSGKYKIEFLETGRTEYCCGNSSKAPSQPNRLLLWRPAVARVAFDARVLEIPVHPKESYEAGQTVRIQTETFRICSGAGEELFGEVARVQKRVDEKTCEVSNGPSNCLVRTGKFTGDSALEEGDVVVLDRSGQIVLRRIGKSGDEYLYTKSTGVDWQDIGGLEDAKRELREAIELPHAHKKGYEWLKLTPPKGFLLFGPAGCGKTLLGKAVATSLAKIYTGRTEAKGFFYVKGPEILQRYVGDSEAKIRELFTNAGRFKEKYGYPAVIFIDEAEAVLRRRGSGISSDIETTIVPMFLAMMDGLSESGAIVILTTNRPDMLDPAVVREGRVDRKILITRPSLREAEDIFRIHLKNTPLSGGDLFRHASSATNELFNPGHVLYAIARRQGTELCEERFCLSDLVSGAMIAGVCNRARALAFRRYADGHKLEGVTEKDLEDAVREVYEENLRFKHTEALEEFVADYREDVVGVKKVTFKR